jgi:O-antigen ligase
MTDISRAGGASKLRPLPRRGLLSWSHLQYLSRAALLLAVLFAVTGVWLWPHAYTGATSEKPVGLGLFQGCIEVFAALVAAAHVKYLLQSAKYTWPILIYLGFISVHEIWVSQDLNASLRSIATYFEIYASISLLLYIDGPARLMRLIVIYAAFFAVINYASLAVPSISRMEAVAADSDDSNHGLLRGFLAHKNDLSACALILAFICYFSNGRAGLKQTSATNALALSLVGLMVLGGSVQGIILFILLSGLGAFLIFQSRFGARLTWSFGVFFIAAMLSMALIGGASLGSVLQHFGRDETLTGRTAIWSYFLRVAGDQPWRGYGIGQWFEQPSSKALLTSIGLPPQIHSAHSSYIEAYLDFGIPGAALLFGLCGLAVAKVIVRLGQPSRMNIIGTLLIVNCLVGGVSAAEKLFLPNIGWFSFVLGFLLLSARPGGREPSAGKGRRASVAAAAGSGPSVRRLRILEDAEDQ